MLFNLLHQTGICYYGPYNDGTIHPSWVLMNITGNGEPLWKCTSCEDLVLALRPIVAEPPWKSDWKPVGRIWAIHLGDPFTDCAAYAMMVGDL